MSSTLFWPHVDSFAWGKDATVDDAEKEAAQKVFDEVKDGVEEELERSYKSLAARYGATDHMARWSELAPEPRWWLARGLARTTLDYHSDRRLSIPREAKAAPPPAVRAYASARSSDEAKETYARALLWQSILYLIPDHWIPSEWLTGPVRLSTAELGLAEPTSFEVDLKAAPLGGAAWVREKTRAEWATLREHLEDGRPWPVCVFDRASPPLCPRFVIAYDFEEREDAVEVVYVDPLRPRVNERLRVPTSSNGEEPDEDENEVAGFFCEPYEAKRPPSKWWERPLGLLRVRHAIWQVSRRLLPWGR